MAEDVEEDSKTKGLGIKGWLVVTILSAALGGGGFAAARSGLIPMPSGGEGEVSGTQTQSPRFVELDPLLISVGGPGSIRQLRFRAFLQVPPEKAAEVGALSPRILDTFGSYLRALDTETLEDPTALMRIRAQLLRRLRLLSGPDSVTDLLIIDFVIT